MLDRNDNGGFIFADICQNEIAQPDWLEFVASAAIGTGGEVGTNSQVSPRTLIWRVINMASRMVLRLGISRADFVMGMAHFEHATGACSLVV